MKNLLITCILLSAIVIMSCKNNISGSKMTSAADTASYAYGVYIAKGLKSGNMEHLSLEMIYRGMKDVIEGKNDTMEVYNAQVILNDYYSKYQTERNREQYAENKKKGEEFLALNKNEEGVVTLPSGLQYQVIREGTGPKPQADDIVNVIYTGSLIDGTVFESNKDKEPVTLQVNGVIPGWTEALLMMNTGSVWKIFIPQELAYGESGTSSGVIKPYSTLIFEIELVSIEPKK